MKYPRLLLSIILFMLTCQVSTFADKLEFVGPGSDWTSISNWRNLSNSSSPRIPYSYDEVIISSSVSVGQDISVGKLTISNSVAFSSVGNVVCYDLVVMSGANFKISGHLATGGHPVYVADNASLNVASGVSCANLSTGSNSDVVIVGGLKTCPSSLDINGSLSISGDVYCASIQIAPNCSFSVDGNISNSNNEVKLSDGSSFSCTGDFDCGVITLPVSDGSFYVGGQFAAIYVIVPDKVYGTTVDVDFHTTNINNNTWNTTEVIERLIRAGAYSAVEECVWLGSVSDDWFDSANWLVLNSNIKRIPDEHTDVTIGATSVNSPVIRSAQQALARNIYIDSDSKCLTIAPGASLYARSMYVSNKDVDAAIVIQHSYDATASLRITAGSVFEGDASRPTHTVYDKVRVERTLQTGVVYYCGSATAQGVFSGFVNLNDNSNSYYDDLFKYRVYDEKYERVGQFSSFADAGDIYLDSFDGSSVLSERTLIQTGTICDSEAKMSFPLGLYGDGTSFGWNLISNPYQYSFPLSDGAQFERDGVSFVSIRRFDSVSGQYATTTYSFDTGVSLPRLSSVLSADKQLYIAPQQAFFVKAHSVGEFVFVPSAVEKSGTDFLQNSSLKSLSSVPSDALYLSLASDASKSDDQVALVFRQGGTLAVNNGDADKLADMSHGSNQLYLLKDESPYAVGLYPEFNTVVEESLPLGFSLPVGATEASISVLNLDEFDESIDVFLIDALGEISEVNLRETPSYSFIAEPDMRIDNRFSIVLRNNKSLSGIDETNEGRATSISQFEAPSAYISAAASGVTVRLNHINSPATISIFDMAGRLVSRSQSTSNNNTISLADSKGIYLVEVVSGDYIKTSKVLLK